MKHSNIVEYKIWMLWFLVWVKKKAMKNALLKLFPVRSRWRLWTFSRRDSPTGQAVQGFHHHLSRGGHPRSQPQCRQAWQVEVEGGGELASGRGIFEEAEGLPGKQNRYLIPDANQNFHLGHSAKITCCNSFNGVNVTKTCSLCHCRNATQWHMLLDKLNIRGSGYSR